MILPKGEVSYENLRTAFVELNSFLQTLKEDNFTGYVQISFWDYVGILFLEGGEIVSAIEEAEGKRRSGEGTMENIIRMSKQKDGRIDVYKLVPELVTILASTTMNDATYKDLSTEFTSLDRLLEKLSKESHSGYIDITLNDNKGKGIIVFQEGEIVEAVMADEKSEWVAGKNMVNNIIDNVQKTGANFNVYRAGLERRLERSGMVQTPDLQGGIEVIQEIMKTIESVVDGLAKSDEKFSDILKKAQIEKSEDYPFLDPFAEEFEYKNGQITLKGQVPLEVFVSGIRDCIDLSLAKVPLEITKDELYGKIRTSLKPVIAKFGKEIDTLGLKSTMPAFLISSFSAND
jgi:hypothetical protein